MGRAVESCGSLPVPVCTKTMQKVKILTLRRGCRYIRCTKPNLESDRLLICFRSRARHGWSRGEAAVPGLTCACQVTIFPACRFTFVHGSTRTLLCWISHYSLMAIVSRSQGDSCRPTPLSVHLRRLKPFRLDVNGHR